MFTIDTQEVKLALSQLKKSVQWKHRRYNYGERYFRMVDAQRRKGVFEIAQRAAVEQRFSLSGARFQ